MKEQQITKYLQLPYQFKTAKLQHDISLITDRNWISHFNTGGYNGEWKAIPLYASNGDGSNIYAFSANEATVSETPIMKECVYFKEIIDSFKFPILSARLLRLGAGANIKPHRDYNLGYEDGNFRLHIPIFTNKDVHFVLDGTQLTMLAGECWYTNVNYVHSVSNLGKSDRIHLVIDGKRNKWSDELFFSLAPAESFQSIHTQNHSPETIQRIMEELARNNLPSSTKLIIQLEQELTILNANSTK